MEFIEYGKQNQPVVVFLREGNPNDWPNRDHINALRKKYRVVMPVLRRQKEAPALSEEEAMDIAAYLSQRYQGSVYALCGSADAWDILWRLIQKRRVTSVKTVIESDETEPGKLVAALLHS